MLPEIVLVGLFASACGGGSTCEESGVWHVALSAVDAPPGAAGRVGAAPDGSAVVAMGGGFAFDGATVTSPQIARISANGHVTTIVPVAVMANETAQGIGFVDDLTVIAWGALGGDRIAITAHGADLAPRWSASIPGIPGSSHVDVGPNGVTAIGAASSSGAMLHTLDRDGVPGWAVPLNGGIFRVAVATNGDVFAFVFSGSTGMHRRRYAAADGALLEDVPVAITLEGNPGNLTPQVAERDGGFVTAGSVDNGSSARIARYAVDGALRWERVITNHNIANSADRAIVSDTGDVLARTSTGDDPDTRFQLLRFDGATGATIADLPLCADFVVTNADATGYLGFGVGNVARCAD